MRSRGLAADPMVDRRGVRMEIVFQDQALSNADCGMWRALDVNTGCQ
jgi:hypothetical protein